MTGYENLASGLFVPEGYGAARAAEAAANMGPMGKIAQGIKSVAGAAAGGEVAADAPWILRALAGGGGTLGKLATFPFRHPLISLALGLGLSYILGGSGHDSEQLPAEMSGERQTPAGLERLLVHASNPKAAGAGMDDMRKAMMMMAMADLQSRAMENENAQLSTGRPDSLAYLPS